MSTGFCLSPIVNTGTPCFAPFTSNCLIAAGRYTSQATNKGFFPFFLSCPAIFAQVVVLPAPLRPAIRKTVISFPGLITSSVISEPIKDSISSFTIFITIWPGLSPVRTSCPIALSVTVLTKDFTTRKLTSASNKALFTSFIASFTSASVRRPLLLKFLKTFCNLSVRLSNAITKSPCS